MITLRQLLFLTKVAETGSFSRAAELCHVTQPTLSGGIKELEDRLGAQLIERSTRHVMLTPLGEDVLHHARQMLHQAAEIEAMAKARRNPFEGDLRLGTIPTIGPYLLPRAMPRIRSAFPGLRVYLREELTEALIDGLEAGRLDLLLIALPFDTGTLHTLHLFEDGYFLAAPSGWPTPARPDPLAQVDQLMLLEKGHCLQRHALAAYPGKLLLAQDSFAATSLPTLVAMVSEGLGVTLLPDLAVRAGIAANASIRLTPLPDACPRRIVLAWRSGSARSALFERLGAIIATFQVGQIAADDRTTQGR
jgi:LysR family hydrogen peroxide-inducible transcriptional activator